MWKRRFLFDHLTFSESMFSTTGHASTFDNLSICLIVPPPTFIPWRSSNWNDAIAFIVVFSTSTYFEVFHRFDHVTSKVHKWYEPRDGSYFAKNIFTCYPRGIAVNFCEPSQLQKNIKEKFFHVLVWQRLYSISSQSGHFRFLFF